MRARLDRFESRYGVSSEGLADAFRDDGGELVETDDFAEWSMAWTIWRHIQDGDRVNALNRLGVHELAGSRVG